MTAPPITDASNASCNLNNLRRGATYRATTRTGHAIGEYLGIEVPYGDPAILLRHHTGTESIALTAIASIQMVGA